MYPPRNGQPFVYQPQDPPGNEPTFVYQPQAPPGNGQTFAYQPQAPPKKIHAFLPWSILNIICCGFVPGGIALVFSILVRRRIREGDFVEAKKFSTGALITNIFALILGLISWAIAIYYIVYAVKVAENLSHHINRL